MDIGKVTNPTLAGQTSLANSPALNVAFAGITPSPHTTFTHPDAPSAPSNQALETFYNEQNFSRRKFPHTNNQIYFLQYTMPNAVVHFAISIIVFLKPEFVFGNFVKAVLYNRQS